MNKEFRGLRPEEFFPLLLAPGKEKEAQQYLQREQQRLRVTLPFFYDKSGHLNEERFKCPDAIDKGGEKGYQILRHQYFSHLIELGVPFKMPLEKEALLSTIPEHALDLLIKPAEDYVHSWLWLEVGEGLRKSYQSPINLGELWDFGNSVWTYKLPTPEEKQRRKKVPANQRQLKFSELVELPAEITHLADHITAQYREARGYMGCLFPEKELPIIRQMNRLHRLSTAYVFENFPHLKYFREKMWAKK